MMQAMSSDFFKLLFLHVCLSFRSMFVSMAFGLVLCVCNQHCFEGYCQLHRSRRRNKCHRSAECLIDNAPKAIDALINVVFTANDCQQRCRGCLQTFSSSCFYTFAYPSARCSCQLPSNQCCVFVISTASSAIDISIEAVRATKLVAIDRWNLFSSLLSVDPTVKLTSGYCPILRIIYIFTVSLRSVLLFAIATSLEHLRRID
uniref:Apple domain-containing protein n=1 Tax=Panagrellus redivivus TaxID=6233 RepID=A0A7E4VYR8_PANRE